VNQKAKTSVADQAEWIERIMFDSGERAFSDRLASLLVICKRIKPKHDLADVMTLLAPFAESVNQQCAVVDVTPVDLRIGRFLRVGNYRIDGDLGPPARLADLRSPVQRKQVVEDYRIARAFGQPLYAKVRGQLLGQQWSYDRILAPVRTREHNLLVTAFWHHETADAAAF